MDAKRGRQIWEFAAGQPIRCSPAVAGGIVYCGSDNGVFYALDARMGKPVWQFETGGPVQASPAVVGDRLFQSGVLGQYGTRGATSIPLDAQGGPPPESMLPTLEGVWMLSPQPLEGAPELASMAAPLALGDRLCFATLPGKVILTQLDVTRLWDYRLGGPSPAPPVAADGLLVVGCDDGNLYTFREEQQAE